MRRPEILACALLVIACKRNAPSASTASDASVEIAPTTTEAPHPPFDAAYLDVGPYDARDPDALAQAAYEIQMRMLYGGIPPAPPPIVRVKSIGHTSVVFKIEHEGGTKAVFKPRSKKGFDRWKGEVAATRLARVLGIRAVPTAYADSHPLKELVLHAAGDERAAKLLAEEVVADGDVVNGATIQWLDEYTVLPLEKEPLLSQWRGWLQKDAVIPDDKKDFARDVSTLILFDFVTGNWDRWSGGNVATSKGQMYYVDNDGAFFADPPKDALARNKRYLEGVDRFSKSVVDRLKQLDDERLANTLDLLSKKALDGVVARRKEALTIIAKKELYFD